MFLKPHKPPRGYGAERSRDALDFGLLCVRNTRHVNFDAERARRTVTPGKREQVKVGRVGAGTRSPVDDNMVASDAEADEEEHHGPVETMISSAMSALSASVLIGEADGSVQRHGTVAGSTATLANCAIGAGVLATPYALSKFGYVGGALVILIAALLVAFTLITLVCAGSEFGSTSYQGLVRDAFGKRASQFVSASLVVYLFGSCVAYLIIIGDSYSKVVGTLARLDSSAGIPWWASRHFAIAVVASFLVTPLSLLREMSRLAPASAMALMALAYTALAIMFDGITRSSSAADGVSAVAFRMDVDSISAVPIIVFAFQCHIQVLAIFSELSAGSPNEPDFGEDIEPITGRDTERKRLRRMYQVVALAVGFCFVGYLLVAEFAYTSHPDVTSNVLDSYDKSDKAMLLATALMGCSAVASFPVNHHAARAALDDLLASVFGWTECAPGQAPVMRHATQTIAFVLGTSILAFSLEDLGKVFELIGATCGSLVMFVIPALILLHPRMREVPKNETVLDDDLRGLDDYTRELLSSVRGLLGEEERENGEEEGNEEEEEEEESKVDVGAAIVASILMLIAVFVAVSNIYVLFFFHRAAH